MNINIIACEIEIELSIPVLVSKDGQKEEVVDVLFRKPNRQKAPFFENLCSMFNRSLAKNIELMKEFATEEQLEDAKAKNEASAEKGNEDMIKSLENITVKDIEDETEGMIAMLSTMDFDFDRAYKLLDRILIPNDKRYTPCLIGGVKPTPSILENIDYQDVKRMMVTYIAFFGKPAKSGTLKDSELQSESGTLVTEVLD